LEHAAQRGSTSRHSSWSKPVNHLKNAPEQVARHSDLRHLEGHVAPVHAIFAPIFTSFSRGLVSDNFSMPSGSASVRGKFARLYASA
jgi:hypothetical protein